MWRIDGRKCFLFAGIMLLVLLAVAAVSHVSTYAATSSSAMTTSADGIALITKYEGCKLTAYDDLQPSVTLTEDTEIIGTLTIGYGHTGTIDGGAIAWNTTITQEKAEELLAEDLLVYETAVNNLASDNGLTFTQNQFDALVSFTYNVGQNKWTNGSTFRLKTYLLNGIENYSNYEITAAFTAFNTSGGTVLSGLTRRRKSEAAMFLGNPTIDSYGAGTYIVTTSSLNVRSGAGSSYSKVTTLSEGDTITVTETSGYWGQYSDGWVSLDYCICLYGSLDTPTLSAISVTNSGIKITWEEVEDAAMYRVYRKTSGGSWKKVADTTSLSYTDKSTLTSNTTYYYSVRCVTSDGKYSESSYDKTGLSAEYYSAPTLTGISNTNSGVKVKWDAVSGASYYRVYRKASASGSWEKLADTTSTSYTDTTVKSGKTYYYTVRCLNSTGKKVASAYDSTGLSIYRILAPELSAVSNTSSGMKLTWNNVSKATKYRVYRKTSSSGSWTKLADTTSTNYTDTTAKTGTTYYYTVRAYSSDGSASAYDSTGLTLMRLVAPENTKTSNTSSGIKLTWDAATKASKYYVYRKTSSSGSWTKIGTATSTSYTDKNVSAGKTYYYTVKTVNSDGKTSATATSVSVVRLTVPSLTSASSTSSGVKITWAKVSGAKTYRVYRRSSTSDSWTKIADTTSTSYTDKTAVSGKTYYYTVRAYSSDGSSSSYDSTGLKIKYSKSSS